MFYKPEIREKMQRRRKQLDAVSILQASQAVAAQVVQIREFLEGRRIACYLAMEGELDPMPILHCAQTLHKQLYLPAIVKAADHSLQPLAFHSYQIGAAAGATGETIDVRELDVIFLPLVAFDENGNRLGRGAGHYDRTLSFIQQERPHRKPYLIGLGYDFQKVPEMKPDKWDVPLNMIATEKKLYVNRGVF